MPHALPPHPSLEWNGPKTLDKFLIDVSFTVLYSPIKSKHSFLYQPTGLTCHHKQCARYINITASECTFTFLNTYSGIHTYFIFLHNYLI
jgi:hypothetical protein